MNISAKTEYACLAMLELAANYNEGQPVRIRLIAEKHGIPSRFLVQILLQLKSAGLAGSTRGASGGYQLLKSPQEITLGDVMAAIEGPSGALTNNALVASPASRVLLKSWQEVADTQREMLAAITLADLVEEIRGQTENMYYI